MREKLQKLWASSGRWFLLGLPLAASLERTGASRRIFSC